MRARLFPMVAAVTLSGCAAGAQVLHQRASYDQRALDWAAVVAKASGQPDFAGSERTADRLYLAYTREPESNRWQITDRADVEAVLAPYTRAQLEARVARAARFLEASEVPYIALAADLRSGDVVVTDVDDATKVGPFYCDQLIRFPRTVPGADIGIRDERTCGTR